jgi:squalene synthase HpnC
MHPMSVPESSPEVPAAAAVMRKARAENFSVASRLLPPRLRRHLLAIYGFARLVDDLGDEYEGDRSAALDELEADLDRIYAGEQPRHEALRPLPATIRKFELPREPFDKLIQANRQDQAVNSYQTWEDLLAYCELSANPVGHLVLHVLRAATPERIELSDEVCTALQLIEHWQDVGEDFRRERLYIPFEDMQQYSVTEEDLSEDTTLTNVRTLVYFETFRTRQLLEDGAPLVGMLSGWGKLAVAGYVGGGFATLDAIERIECAVLPVGPKSSKVEKLKATWRVLRESREEDE